MAKNLRSARALRWAVLILAGVVSACSFGPRKDVGIRAEAQPSLNRDDQGRPLSVVLRIYQLRDAGEFSRAPFEQLTRRDRELLGNDLIDRREVVMVPDTTFADVQKLADNTRYVGVMAMFRRPDTRMWRYVFDRKDFDRGGIAFRLEDCAIRVMAGKPISVEGDPQSLTPVCRDETPARQAPAVRPAQPIRR